MRYERVVMLAVVGTLGVWAVTCKSDNGGGPPSGGTPSVDVGADLSIQPSQTVSFTGRIALPNGANASDYHWTLTWGDGTTDTGTLGSDGFVTAAHSYGSVGEYPLHLAAQHVEELRQLVDLGAAQQGSQREDPGVVLSRDAARSSGLALMHGPELEHGETGSRTAHPAGSVEHGPRAREPDGQRREGEHRRDQREADGREHDVKQAFHHCGASGAR